MKKAPLLLLEILVVIILITVVAVLGIDKYHELFNNFPRYTVKFKDVDGLSVGAPVRFAGVRVGHIVKLELKENQIITEFKVTDRKIKIPEDSVVGIEFTGLGGSKSLELQPPSKKLSANKQFSKIEPVRVGCIMEIQKDISEATVAFFDGVLSFLDQNKDTASRELKKSSKLIKEQSEALDKVKKSVDEQSQNASESREKLQVLIEETNKSVTEAGKNIEGMADNKVIIQSMDNVKKSVQGVSEFVEKGKIKDINKEVTKLNKTFNTAKNKELGYINEFNKSVKNMNQNLQKFVNSLTKSNKQEQK